MNRSITELAAAQMVSEGNGFRPSVTFLPDGTVDSASYKAQSRAYISKMIAAGRGAEVQAELAGNLGLKPGVRPKLVSFAGHKLR